MKPAHKKVLIFFTVILIAATGFIIYKTYFLEDKVKQLIVEEINENSEGKYELTIDDVTIQLLKKSLHMNGISFKTTEETTQEVHAEIESVSLDGFKLFRFLIYNEVFINKIEIRSPSILIRREFTGQSGQDLQTLIGRGHAEDGGGLIQNVFIPETEITNLTAELKKMDDTSFFSLESADLTLTEISFSEEQTGNRTIPVEEILISTKKITHKTDNGLYTVSADSTNFSSVSGSFAIHHLQLIPEYDETEFFDQVGYRTDRIELTASEIELSELDFDHILHHQQLLAENLVIRKTDLNIYRDQNYPRREQRDVKPLPQEMIKSLPFPVYISAVDVGESSIRYEELHEDASERGGVHFNELYVSASNFTNIDTLMVRYAALEITTASKFMDRSALNVDFTIPYQENLHNIEGSLASTDPLILNQVFEPLAGVRIESGMVHSLRFEMQLNETRAVGNAEVIYDDLHIALVDQETTEKNLLRRIGSFFINTFVIKSQNPQEDPRPGEIDYEREPEKSVFNYWWKSLQSGLTDSMGG